MPESAATEPRLRWQVRRLDSVDSTNRYLLDEARAGAPEGVVAVADHQSAGRGRLGRRWEAPPGSSLLVSVLLRPTLGAADLHLVTAAAGLALLDALARTGDVPADLKWPNDVVVAHADGTDRKLAGLLGESDIAADGTVRAVVVGVGCNVSWPEFPPELAAIATACNLVASRPVTRDALLDAFLDELAARYARGTAMASGYREHLVTLGRRVRVEGAHDALVGSAVDVDPAGRLVVRDDGGVEHLVDAGDVVHLRNP